MRPIITLSFVATFSLLSHSYKLPLQTPTTVDLKKATNADFVEKQSVTRRKLFAQTTSTILGLTAFGTNLFTNPMPARAVFIGSPPMVKSWPKLQFLYPIYEFDKSMAVLEQQLDPSQGAKGIAIASRLVENFFKRGLLSNKNVYKGLCTIYMQEIQYDDPDRELVLENQKAFLDDCDMTIQALEAMRKPLKKLVDEGATEASDDVKMSMKTAREGVKNFLGKVPAGDVERIESWIKAVAAADVDKNGALEGDELNSLSDEETEIYQAVKDFLG